MTNNVYANQADELEMERLRRAGNCPACGGSNTEERHIVGTTEVRGVEVEQEAWVTKCRDCGSQWSS